MKHFVYYSDGLYDDGDIGFEEFDTRMGAIGFIEKRINEKQESINSYRLIEGRELTLREVKFATRIEAE